MTEVQQVHLDDETLTPTQGLVVELLAARHRLGESVWTLSAHQVKRSLLDALSSAGWIGWKPGIIEHTYLAWLTDEARAVMFGSDYVSPLLAERDHARAAIEDLEAEVARLRAAIPTDAWFGAWECGCTDTERTPLGIPEFCPVHGRKLLSNSQGSTKVQLNHSGVSGYGFHPGPGAALAD